jgi:hypothetical protein
MALASLHGRQLAYVTDTGAFKYGSAGLIRGALRKVTLTTAQILALNATPITVLAAPGTGLTTVVKGVYAYKPAGTAYAGIAAGEDLTLKYTNASGAIAAQIETTGFLDSASALMATAALPGGLATTNAALVASMLTGEIITGDSDVILWITYDVIPTVLDVLSLD